MSSMLQVVPVITASAAARRGVLLDVGDERRQAGGDLHQDRRVEVARPAGRSGGGPQDGDVELVDELPGLAGVVPLKPVRSRKPIVTPASRSSTRSQPRRASVVARFQGSSSFRRPNACFQQVQGHGVGPAELGLSP